MADQPQNSNSQNDGEVGIIELLNYFKQGFKNFLNSINNLFKKIGNLILQLLILIKDNIVYIMAMVLIFVAGYFVLSNLPGFKNYGYEMVVQPNYNSTEALFANVKALQEIAGKSEYGSFGENLQLIQITPIEDVQDKIDAYYDVMDNEFSSPSTFNETASRDTVYFREVPIKDFVESMKPGNYKKFTIAIKSKGVMSPELVYQNLIEPIENNTLFKTLKESYLKDLEYQNKSNEQSLKLIDTILYSRSKQVDTSQDENISFENGTTKVMEEQLLVQKKNILEDMRLNSIQQSEYAQVISIISDLKPAQAMRRIKRDPKHFALYGFLFAIFTLLFKRFVTYLNNYEANEKSSS